MSNVIVSRETQANEPSYNERLRQARNGLLTAMPVYRAEDVPIGSVTTDASDLARDLKETGRIFGVRIGRDWHYPKFQFDEQGMCIGEMKDVLAALTPDVRGWDRLQWFVTPHEVLSGRTPLEVWESDRSRVVEAARAERWQGRRD